MKISLVLACFWALVTNVLAMTLSKDYHWRNVYILIWIGIPLLGFVTFENGPLIGLLVLIAAMSVLRWPVVYLYRWIESRVTGAVE
jgi:NhaP-type Na+/H+ or K+/H+ antiporter